MTPTLTANETATARPQKLWQETFYSWISTVDHKRIGLLYIGYALLFLLIGGFEAIWSAAFPIDYRDVAVFALLAILLTLRPGGILGQLDPAAR